MPDHFHLIRGGFRYPFDLFIVRWIPVSLRQVLQNVKIRNLMILAIGHKNDKFIFAYLKGNAFSIQPFIYVQGVTRLQLFIIRA